MPENFRGGFFLTHTVYTRIGLLKIPNCLGEMSVNLRGVDLHYMDSVSLSGVSEHEDRSVVSASCLGQRSASGPVTVYALQ